MHDKTLRSNAMAKSRNPDIVTQKTTSRLDILVSVAREEIRKLELGKEKQQNNDHQPQQRSVVVMPMATITKLDDLDFIPRECKRKRTARATPPVDATRTTATTMAAAEEDRRHVDDGSLDDHEEILRREKLLKRPMEIDQNDDDSDEGHLRLGKKNRKKSKKADNDHDGMMIIKEKKNKKVDDDDGPNPPPGLPMKVRDQIREKAQGKGSAINDDQVILVIQKRLTVSDVKRQQNRLFIPIKKLANKFLTEEEEREIKLEGKHYTYKTVDIIEPSGKVHNIPLTRWVSKKGQYGKLSKIFVLNGAWKVMVQANKLQAGIVVQLWAFRISGKLNFAFVKLPKDQEDHQEEGNSADHDAEDDHTPERDADNAASISEAATTPSDDQEEGNSANYAEDHHTPQMDASIPSEAATTPSHEDSRTPSEDDYHSDSSLDTSDYYNSNDSKPPWE